ncbi:thymidine phosphorylase [Poseidonocella pacifica]|uniref:Thymidine phosphorylase n=1 Tax=Poseidonocella pacifica TaxID=871651 RepID=A0A1I0XEN2_9RHOB|nr:thymidine phosphorylase [Poseidonocella pacifica]SFA99157.1 thymidine phosphorylase [Poseidonocella pacifica]
MDARHINARLRHGEALGPEHLKWFAKGLADMTVSDAQAGAFAMGICHVGLGAEGRTALTLAMRDSGRVLDWDLSGPILDKHSTGGVGDCVSLILAPALAACGAFVPMISGRGLGHTGGTLDKLEAIPGVVTSLSEAQFRSVVGNAGVGIVGASDDVAPADKRLYAIRDVTATVDSLDLITASILSKKLAAGIEGLVLDVKCGSGAFMKDPAAARQLAQALVDTANAAGCRTSALVTDMSQPLAPALGNALEVAECMRVLTGDTGGPLLDLSIELGAVLLEQCGLAAEGEGAVRMRASITSGEAAARFGMMISEMGGPTRFVEDWLRFLPTAQVVRDIPAEQSGYLTRVEGEALGHAVVNLGGGRHRESDRIDPSVGLSDIVALGANVEAGQSLARIHAASEEAAAHAEARVRAAMHVTDEVPDILPLVRERIG